MGSFNTSCAVSKLPIGGGDEVVILLAVAAPGIDRSKILYNDHFHNLVGLPFTATYYDYGKFCMEETTRNKEIWEMYNTFFKERLNKEDFLLDEEMNDLSAWNFDFEGIQEHIMEDGLSVKYTNYDGETTDLPVSIFAVHKSVYESLSKGFEYWRGVFDTSKEVESIRSNPSYDYFVNHETIMPEFEKQILADDNDYDEEHEPFNMRVYYQITMARVTAEYGKPPLPFYENVHIERYGMQCKFPLKLQDYLVYAEEFIGLYAFETNLKRLNIQIVPAIAGGQEYNYNSHIDFHKSVIALAEKYRDDKERDY